MNLERFPLGKPLVEVEADGRQYPFTVARDFVYLWPGYGKWAGFPVCIPKGYQTDFLSIPRVLWPLLSPQALDAGGHCLTTSSTVPRPWKGPWPTGFCTMRVGIPGHRWSGRARSTQVFAWAGA